MDTNTLLAFLLALSNPEVDINNTKSLLKQLGNTLYSNPDDWEAIKKKLDIILEGNAALNQAYQAARATLEAVEGDIPPDLLRSGIPRRGYSPGKPDNNSNEIINIAVVVLSHEQPAEISKTLLQRLRDFLKLK